MVKYLFTLCLALPLLLAGCSSEPEVLPTIRLGYSPHDHHAALYIAAQLPEYFSEQGGLSLREVQFKQHYQLIDDGQPVADIKLFSSTGGGQLMRKLHEKQLDISFGGVPAVVKQVDAGSRMKIVAPLMSEGAALVMRKDYPAENWVSFVAAVKAAEQPVRIGYKIETSVQNLIFEQALQSEEINFSRNEAAPDAQVIVRNLFGANNLIPALKNGLIDGFVVMQPFVALAEYQQHGKTIARLRDLPPAQKWLDHPCCGLAANGPLLNNQRDLLEKLAILMMRASRYLQQHPQQSAVLVAKWLGRPVEVEELSLPTIKYLVDYPENWHSGVDFWIRTMVQQGRISGVLRSAAEKNTIKSLLYDMEIYDHARAQVEQE